MKIKCLAEGQTKDLIIYIKAEDINLASIGQSASQISEKINRFESLLDKSNLIGELFCNELPSPEGRSLLDARG